MPVREDAGSPFARERRFAPSDQITPARVPLPLRFLHESYGEPPLRPSGSTANRIGEREPPLAARADTRHARAISNCFPRANASSASRSPTALTAIAHLNHFCADGAMGGAVRSGLDGLRHEASTRRRPPPRTDRRRRRARRRPRSPRNAAIRVPVSARSFDSEPNEWTFGRRRMEEAHQVTRRRRERRASREVACRGGRRGPARPARRAARARRRPRPARMGKPREVVDDDEAGPDGPGKEVHHAGQLAQLDVRGEVLHRDPRRGVVVDGGRPTGAEDVSTRVATAHEEDARVRVALRDRQRERKSIVVLPDPGAEQQASKRALDRRRGTVDVGDRRRRSRWAPRPSTVDVHRGEGGGGRE